MPARCMRGTCRRSWGTSSRTAGCVSTSRTPSSATRASRTPARCARHDRLRICAVRLCAGDVHRARRDPPRIAPAVHAAHVAHQCDFGDRRRRVDRGHWGRLSSDDPHPRGDRAVRLDDQHRERLPDHRPHAQDVQGRRGPEMIVAFTQLSYVVATALFILALHWMNDPKTARRGVYGGVAAMFLAILATWAQPQVIVHHVWIVIAIALGFIVGWPLSRVPLTAVPQRTALSHSFGGLAAGLVGTAEYFLWLGEAPVNLTPFRMTAIIAEIILGYLTFTGSLMAAGKLQEIRWIPQRPVTFPLQNALNIGLLLLAVIVGAALVLNPAAPWSATAFLFIIGLALLFGAFGKVEAVKAASGQQVYKTETIEGAAQLLEQASLVVIVPGYGMAVAQAQHKVRELYDQLKKRGITVRFAIHPVAGYDKSSPIYGMPIIDADKARTVLAIKRSKNPGFAGIDNELYFSDRTWMLFGDAKAVVGELVKQLSGGSGMH